MKLRTLSLTILLLTLGMALGSLATTSAQPKAHETYSKTVDAVGHELHIGDLFKGADGKVYKMNGFTAVPNGGIFSAYGYQVHWCKANQTDCKWVEQHPKAADGDSIIWGSILLYVPGR